VDTGIHRRFGFSFTDPSQEPGGVVVQSVGEFNRRAWLRVVPDRRVTATLSPLDGPSPGSELTVGVADLSAGGIAVLLAGIEPEALRDVSRVRCVVTFPGESSARELDGTIRGREHLTQCLRLGIAFEESEEAIPTYERSWDCSDCGSGQLLAEAHNHCPACGSGRGESTLYLLPWSVIAPSQAHLYAGDDRRCEICRAEHATAATFCGRCGAALI